MFIMKHCVMQDSVVSVHGETTYDAGYSVVSVHGVTMCDAG